MAGAAVRRGAILAALVAAVHVSGCAEVDRAPADRQPRPVSANLEAAATPPAEVSGRPSVDSATAAGQPEGTSGPAGRRRGAAEPRTPQPSSTGAVPSAKPSRPAPEPRRSQLNIPAIGLQAVQVVRYRGAPDDARGTRIQDGGPAASPRGPGGGVAPGEVGNFIITGHRTSHAAPFRDLPTLSAGDRVRVRTGRTEFVYRITATRWTSFRSPRSRAEQTAAVPGRPGAEPTRAMITLSTCATPEDHANGNYWSDRFGNPEHRIDKIGVLVAQTRVRG